MTYFKLAGAIAALALSCGATAAQATDVSFSGSMTGSSTGGLDSSCAPLPFRTSIAPETTVGTSTSLGDFTYSSNVCQGGGVNGIFTIFFGDGSISGTQVGTAVPTSIERLFDLNLTYTILSGTGAFTGATGSFVGVGIADSRTAPTQVSLLFRGVISTAAVPEPATWALMLLGFGAIGMTARRGRRRMLPPGVGALTSAA